MCLSVLVISRIGPKQEQKRNVCSYCSPSMWLIVIGWESRECGGGGGGVPPIRAILFRLEMCVTSAHVNRVIVFVTLAVHSLTVDVETRRDEIVKSKLFIFFAFNKDPSLSSMLHLMTIYVYYYCYWFILRNLSLVLPFFHTVKDGES